MQLYLNISIQKTDSTWHDDIENIAVDTISHKNVQLFMLDFSYSVYDRNTINHPSGTTQKILNSHEIPGIRLIVGGTIVFTQKSFINVNPNIKYLKIQVAHSHGKNLCS